MRHEQEDIDEESEQGDEERGQLQDEQYEKITGRMRGAVEMGGEGHEEADQRKEGSNRMNDQDG